MCSEATALYYCFYVLDTLFNSFCKTAKATFFKSGQRCINEVLWDVRAWNRTQQKAQRPLVITGSNHFHFPRFTFSCFNSAIHPSIHPWGLGYIPNRSPVSTSSHAFWFKMLVFSGLCIFQYHHHLILNVTNESKLLLKKLPWPFHTHAHTKLTLFLYYTCQIGLKKCPVCVGTWRKPYLYSKVHD